MKKNQDAGAAGPVQQREAEGGEQDEEPPPPYDEQVFMLNVRGRARYELLRDYHLILQGKNGYKILNKFYKDK